VRGEVDSGRRERLVIVLLLSRVAAVFSSGRTGRTVLLPPAWIWGLLLVVAGGSADLVAEDAPVADLARRLASKQEAERREALVELRNKPDLAKQLFPELIRRFRDPVPELRVLAADVVASTGEAGRKWLPHFIWKFYDTDVTKENKPVWYLVAEIVGRRMGKDVLDDMIGLLDEKKIAECRGACVAIHEIGEDAKPAVSALIRLLDTRTVGVELEVLYALRGIGPAAEEAVPALVRALDAENMHTRYWAAQALAAIGEKAAPATPDLIRKLETGLASVRRHSATALGKIGPKIGKPGVEALIKALDDFAFIVREDSLDALARLGPAASQAAPVLKKKLVEGKLDPVGRALYAYWRVSGDLEFVQPRFLARFEEENAAIEAIPQLARMGKAAEFAVPALVQATRSDDAVIRLLAVEALEEVGVWNDEVAAAIHERLTRETDIDTRRAAGQVHKRLRPATKQRE